MSVVHLRDGRSDGLLPHCLDGGSGKEGKYMLRLVVLVGVVSCSPLPPQELTPPAATASNHHHHHHHATAAAAAAVGSPSLSAHFPPPLPSAQSSSSSSSPSHIDVSHEVRHVTYEISEEVKDGVEEDDLTTPGDVPEDDPPIPTATTPPALPDTHTHHHHQHHHQEEGHPDTSRPQVILQSGDDDDDVPLSDGVQSHDVSRAGGVESYDVQSPDVETHGVLSPRVELHGDDTRGIQAHSEDGGTGVSVSVNQPSDQAAEESVASQLVVHESDQHGGLHGESVERDPSDESFEHESVEEEHPSGESVEKPSTELAELETSTESAERETSTESAERETSTESAEKKDEVEQKASLESAEIKDPFVDSVESETALIESVERELQIESAGSVDTNHGVVDASQEPSNHDDNGASVGGSDSREVVVSGGDGNSENVKSIAAVAVSDIREVVSSGENSESVKSAGGNVGEVVIGDGDGEAGASIVSAVIPKHEGDRAGDEDSQSVESDANDGDASTPTPHHDHQHHYHHHHQEEVERKQPGEAIVVSEDIDGDVSEEETVDVRRENSSEEKARIESRTQHHPHHSTLTHETTIVPLNREYKMKNKESSNNTVQGYVESIARYEGTGKSSDGGVETPLEPISGTEQETPSDHSAMRTIQVWKGESWEAAAPYQEGEKEKNTEEYREERKTRPEVDDDDDEEIPTFIMDSSAPIDIVERSQGHGGTSTQGEETLETSASEVTEEVVSKEDEAEVVVVEGSDDVEAGRRSRTYIESPSNPIRLNHDGLEIMSRTSPTPVTSPGITEDVSGSLEVKEEEESARETPPVEDKEEDTLATSSPIDFSSEETISEEEEETREEEETGEEEEEEEVVVAVMGEKDMDKTEEDSGSVEDSRVVATDTPKDVPPQDYTESYGDPIISGDNLPDFTVTREDLPSLTHPVPDVPPIPSNRGNSRTGAGGATWHHPTQQERVSVAAPTSLTPGCIVAIVFGVIVSLSIIIGIGGFVMWQRRTLNRPKALGSDRGYAGSDSLGYLDDQVHVSYVNSQVDSTKGSPEDLISLDMDSDFFLNSLESMTIQNLWPENIRHTKL
ncbi:hypothetical protein Pcinc_029532 [Petrolisthes cinctipes]|uniref:Uncharacterized protein n=1 Tax=Petrolisthes cinctipes TaxID=88211 RepID=A0AAE1K5L0_PETCI|nr:hypothetical protein Pcinc_029532 [Petrolisthes cinctipes]